MTQALPGEKHLVSGYLAEHQVLALRKLSNGKILKGGVGSGKSRVAAVYYQEHEAPKDVYVITTAKKRNSLDWESTFAQLNIGPRSGPIQPPDNVVGCVPSKRRTGSKVSSRGKSQRSGDRETPSTMVDGQPASSIDGLEDARSDVLEVHVRGESHNGRAAAAFPGEAGTYPYVLTVDSWNNLHKYADVAGAFFIFDEQRVVGSGDWARKFIRISKRNTWLLLTATPGDTWMDYVPVFVANGFYKNRSEFIREHVVYNNFSKFPKIDRFIGAGKLAKNRAAVIVDMPFERHTRRRHVSVDLPYDKEMLDRVLKDRWHVYQERPLRDVGEMFSVARRVVNSDPSRLEMVCELWKTHPKLIVFYNFNYELASLRSLKEYYNLDSSTNKAGLLLSGKSISVSESSTSTTAHSSRLTSSDPSLTTGKIPTSIAEWNGHKHEPVPTSDRWLYLVQYIAGAEAWECTTTDAMILYSQTYSYKIYEQALGRIDRLNTAFKELWYYNFTSESFIDKAIGRSLKAKRSFNEAEYRRIFEP